MFGANQPQSRLAGGSNQQQLPPEVQAKLAQMSPEGRQQFLKALQQQGGGGRAMVPARAQGSNAVPGMQEVNPHQGVEGGQGQFGMPTGQTRSTAGMPIEPAAAIPAEPEMANPNSAERMDSNRALWAGTIADIGNFIGSAGRQPMQGLGMKYMMAANRNNRDISQDERRNKLVDLQTKQAERELEKKNNIWQNYTKEEQNYQAWLQSGGKTDSEASRNEFADYQMKVDPTTAPSNVREWNFYSNLSPEQQKQFKNMKRTTQPWQAYMEGDYDPEAMERDKAVGKTTGTQTTEQYGTMRAAIMPMRSALASLTRVRNALAAGPETGPTSGYSALINEELQVLRGLLSDELFSKVAAVKASGVTFGQMTIAEWDKLEETISTLTNRKGANLKIVDSQIAKVKRQLDESMTMIESYDPGKWMDLPEGEVSPYSLGGPGNDPKVDPNKQGTIKRPGGFVPDGE